MGVAATPLPLASLADFIFAEFVDARIIELSSRGHRRTFGNPQIEAEEAEADSLDFGS